MVSLISSEEQSFFTARPQRFRPSAFPGFDVAKLGADKRKCKKTASTTENVKAMITNTLKNSTLYNEKMAGGTKKEVWNRNIYKTKRKSLIMNRGV